MKEAMIDIETLSTKPNALILTIGIIRFDRFKDSIEIQDSDKLYYRIDRESCEKLNMDIDSSTVEWWSKQTEETKNEALYGDDRVDISFALKKISIFLRDCTHIWSNSPNFDCIILENAYRKCNLKIPWNFWQLRDCRTLYDLANIKLSNETVVKHNALDDCYNQLICLNKSLKKLKLI